MAFKAKILVVDDEPQMLALLGEVLTQMGTEPRCLSSSRQAEKLINQEKFDGIFLDWLMPELNGLELAREIRWSKSNSLCPIVMISGNPEPDALRECFRVGIHFFLSKPVTVEQIRHLVTATHDLMLQERLRYQRIPLQTPVLCQWQVASFQQKARGHSVNLSCTGMLVTLDPTPALASLAKLEFHLPGDPRLLTLTAIAVRLAPNQRVGLRFINLTREKRWRLAEFSKSASEVGAGSSTPND